VLVIERKELEEVQAQDMGRPAPGVIRDRRLAEGENFIPGLKEDRPLTRRVPKRGFKSPFKEEFEVVNVEDLNIFEPNSVVDPELLKRKGLIKKTGNVKILGEGSLEKPLHVKAHAFSKTAEEKIKKAGGKLEVLKC